MEIKEIRLTADHDGVMSGTVDMLCEGELYEVCLEVLFQTLDCQVLEVNVLPLAIHKIVNGVIQENWIHDSNWVDRNKFIIMIAANVTHISNVLYTQYIAAGEYAKAVEIQQSWIEFYNKNGNEALVSYLLRNVEGIWFEFQAILLMQRTVFEKCKNEHPHCSEDEHREYDEDGKLIRCWVEYPCGCKHYKSVFSDGTIGWGSWEELCSTHFWK